MSTVNAFSSLYYLRDFVCCDMCDAAVVQWRHFGENEMTYKFGEEYMP
jgi:hypothetical protein